MTAPTLFKHQREISDFITDNGRALVFADPGTGKTAAVLDAASRHRAAGGGRVLVVCPKSIMRPAWVEDAATFTPHLKVAVAEAPATKRTAALRSDADIVVINHDGVTWLARNFAAHLDGFDFLAIDESTAFKNKDRQRGRAMANLARHFGVRLVMTGTPMSNGLLDVWHQVYLVDDGEHLGNRYYAFRAATCEPVPVTADINKWVPKDGSYEAVADMISPISLRYQLESCVDMPKRQVTTRRVELSPKLRKYYQEMKDQAVLELENGEVEAVHAASLMGKLQQIASGSVYGVDSAYRLAPERYDLIAELCAERDHTLVAFQWKHQRDGIMEALERAGVSNVAVIDGDHVKESAQTVADFQAGHYQVLLAHPKSAGHGLTLTKARTVIWASPTFNAEQDDQFNRRIYRTGQKETTEVIRIVGKDTVDERVVSMLQGKLDTQSTALDLLQSLMPQPA